MVKKDMPSIRHLGLETKILVIKWELEVLVARWNGVIWNSDNIFVTFDKDVLNFVVKHKSGWWYCGNYNNINGIMKERTNNNLDNAYWYNFIYGRTLETLQKTKMTLILKKTLEG